MATTTINFDNLSDGTVVNNQYSSQGVTFDNARIYGFLSESQPNSIYSISDGPENPQANPITARFTGYITAVSLTGVDVGAAGFILKAYGANNALLDSKQYVGNGDGSGAASQTLTVTGTGIARVEFSQLAPDGIDSSVYDNLVFTTQDVDTTPPTLSITSDKPVLKAGETAQITFSFSEDPGASFAWDGGQGDVVVSGGTLSAITVSGQTRTAIFTPDANTNNGTASITVAAGSYTDAANNPGGAGASPSLTFDTLPPSAPVVSAPANGALTNDAAPTVSGTAEANSAVTVYVDNASVGVTTANAAGTWSFDVPSALSQGSHVFRATARDAAGNTSASSASNTTTIDTTAPIATFSSTAGANGSTTSSRPIPYTVSFSESVTGFAAHDVTAINGSVSSFSGSGSLYVFSVTPIGSRPVSVSLAANVLQDMAGNGNMATSSYTLTYQPVTAAPIITGPVNGQATNDSTPTFTGTAPIGSAVTIYVNGAPLGTTTATDGSFSYTPTNPIPDGEKTVYATARLSGQAESPPSANNAFVLDTMAPTAAVTSVLLSTDSGSSRNDLVTNVAAQTVTGALSTPLSAGERVEVSVNDGASWSPATTSGSAWSISTTLAAGGGVLKARVVDAAGNVGPISAPQAYILDTTAPAAPSSPILAASSDTGILGDGITASARPTATGTAEVGSTVILYDTDGSSELGRTLTAGDGRWSITPTAALAEGRHTLTARATDLAGNVGTPSTGLLVIVDSTAPVLNVTSQTGAFVGTAQRITGTVADAADVGATVTLREGMLELGTTIVQADRTWSATVDLGSFGNHTITASATDLAGNTGQVTATFTAAAPPPPAPPPVDPNAPVQSVGAGETLSISGKTSGALEKTGAGTLILTGTNTYTEPTTVQAGTLLVNGSIVSPVSVASGATLGGAGSTGTVIVAAGGALAPGNSPGILSTRDLSLAAGSALKQEIGGAGAGQFDQLKVTGTVALSGANLDVSAFGGFASTRGDRFVIIDNDGTDAVSGSFAGLNEGAVLGFGTRSLRISYRGGDGNDVTLTDTTGLAFQREAFGAVVTSAESQAGQVYGLYEALLNRAPDALGLSGFTTALENGASLTQVAGAILGSVEHGPAQGATAYVESLYANLLNRSADAAGLQSWTGQLAAGASQANVAAQIASSAEAKAVLAPAFANGVFVFDASEASVARLYYGLLDRAPDAGGLRGFSNFIETSGAGPAGEAARLGQVATTILSSAEYTSQHAGQSDAAFVFDLYQDALGRAPDAGGQAGYLNALAHGASRAQVALDITQSHEAQVHLVGLIQDGALLIA